MNKGINIKLVATIPRNRILSVGEHLPSSHKALGLTLSAKKKCRKEREKTLSCPPGHSFVPLYSKCHFNSLELIFILIYFFLSLALFFLILFYHFCIDLHVHILFGPPPLPELILILTFMLLILKIFLYYFTTIA
jgi:hypothetical protein